MVDQDHIQKTIRAYVSAALVMKSSALSPRTQEYLRAAVKTLEMEIASVREEGSAQSRKAA